MFTTFNKVQNFSALASHKNNLCLNNSLTYTCRQEELNSKFTTQLSAIGTGAEVNHFYTHTHTHTNVCRIHPETWLKVPGFHLAKLSIKCGNLHHFYCYYFYYYLLNLLYYTTDFRPKPPIQLHVRVWKCTIFDIIYDPVWITEDAGAFFSASHTFL